MLFASILTALIAFNVMCMPVYLLLHLKSVTSEFEPIYLTDWLKYLISLFKKGVFPYAFVLLGFVMTIGYILFTITEIAVLKLLYINYFSRMAGINEYFISTFLIRFNGLELSLVVAIKAISGEAFVSPWFCSGKQMSEFHKRINFWWVTLTLFWVFFTRKVSRVSHWSKKASTDPWNFSCLKWKPSSKPL